MRPRPLPLSGQSPGAEILPNDDLVSHHGGLDERAPVVTDSLLPSHAAFVGDLFDVSVSRRRCREGSRHPPHRRTAAISWCRVVLTQVLNPVMGLRYLVAAALMRSVWHYRRPRQGCSAPNILQTATTHATLICEVFGSNDHRRAA